MNVKEKLALEAFATALLYLPKTLAANAGFDPIDVVTNLQRIHTGQIANNNNGENFWYGIDLETGEIKDMRDLGVLEPCGVKMNALSLAVEAASVLLKVD